MVQLSDLIGTTKVDPQAAIDHLKFFFEPDDIVHITAFRGKRASKKYTSVLTIAGTLDETVEQLSEDGLDWVRDGDSDNPWNVYYSIAPASEGVDGINRRPNKSHASGIRQVFGDLDVKPGGFESAEQIAEFVGGLSIPPSAIVWTGSGGAHVSWRIAPDDRAVMWQEDHVGERWWCYLDSEAKRLGFDVSIDRLIDSESRVLRLPGTVRWPKVATDMPNSVIGYILDNDDLTHAEFVDAVREPYSVYLERVRKRKQDDITLNDQALQIGDPDGKWSKILVFGFIDECCEKALEWSTILEPHGWTILREGGDGSTEWTRPGGAGKSATTDWPDSPEVMSLFSTDEGTGLSDLLEAEIPLTKWRVFLRLEHDDDVSTALDDLARRVRAVDGTV